jgi:hypothetical protein
MYSKNSSTKNRALVTVLDDLPTANRVIETLHGQGIALSSIELVTHNLHEEAPELETPKVHETTASNFVEGAARWGGAGAGLGAIAAAVLAPFPGLGLGMILVGGLTGAVVGGLSGLDQAVDDDSIDLPTLEEYETLIQRGNSLVVVLGDHAQVMRAEKIIKAMNHVRMHIHLLHGHEFHEHPAQGVTKPR